MLLAWYQSQLDAVFLSMAQGALSRCWCSWCCCRGTACAVLADTPPCSDAKAARSVGLTTHCQVNLSARTASSSSSTTRLLRIMQRPAQGERRGEVRRGGQEARAHRDH